MDTERRQVWINFCENERIPILEPSLSLLLTKLSSSDFKPSRQPYKKRIETRRFIVQNAIDLEIDFSKIKKIGRGILDVWNEEYRIKFGSNIGTAGVKECSRRNIILRLKKEI